jgi:transitional endoplasmic reticulum ATPase
MQEHFGWAQMVPKMSFFGPEPPQMIAVKDGPTSTVRIPWGQFELPGIDGVIAFDQTTQDKMMMFRLGGQVKQKHYGLICKMVDRAREIAREQSIYKGKAIRFKLASNFTDMIAFIDVSGVDPEELVLPKVTEAEINRSLFAPILHAEACKHFKVPVKRGVLLVGAYGVGKTMTANVAARFCEDVKRTFIYVEKAAQLSDAVNLAQQYLPALVFCEDIDRITSGDRDEGIDKLANIIDGVQTRLSEILLVLTTNDVDSIHPVMLRPGRMDSIIPIEPPDAPAARKLVENYAGDLLIATDEELNVVGEKLQGKIPAVIREAVERAKLHAIYRQNGSLDKLKLTAPDLLASAAGLEAQIELLNRPKPEDTPQTRLFDSMQEVVASGVGNGGLEKALDASRKVTSIEGTVEEIHQATV